MGTFWAENYTFIKDVYDTRAAKMSELMDAMDKSIGDILADKIYTSAEFKKVKELFMVRNIFADENYSPLSTFLAFRKSTIKRISRCCIFVHRINS